MGGRIASGRKLKMVRNFTKPFQSFWRGIRAGNDYANCFCVLSFRSLSEQAYLKLILFTTAFYFVFRYRLSSVVILCFFRVFVPPALKKWSTAWHPLYWGRGKVPRPLLFLLILRRSHAKEGARVARRSFCLRLFWVGRYISTPNVLSAYVWCC